LNRRQFTLSLTAAGGALAAAGAFAQAAFTEGKEFARLGSPVKVSVAPGKIDVVEFFSFACPHCFALEPALEAWTKRLPAQVHFHRVPVPFLFNAQNFQPLYYTLEALNLVDALQMKVFNAFHVDHDRLDSPEAIAAFVQKNGVDAARFMAVFKSFSVQARAREAGDIVSTFNVDEVPTIAVQGRYTTSLARGGSPEGTTRVVDHLIAEVAAGPK
jgi:thiol:disulfide interchange protein DsbA